MRKPLLLWHRWFGIVGGVWLFIIAFTGSIIVFESEIDQALNADLYSTAAPAGTRIGPQIAASVAEGAWPGFATTHIGFPEHPNSTYRVYLTALPGENGESRPQAFIDPYTGVYLGGRDGAAIDLGARGIVGFIYKLHHSLHAGDTVEWLLGIVALLWLIDHLAATILSFPNAARWRDSFRIRKRAMGHKRAFDLHRAIGLWLLPVTAMLAFSGTYFNWRAAYDLIVSPLGERTQRADQSQPKLPEPLVSPPVDYAGAIRTALAHAPDIEIGAVSYSQSRGLYLVRTFDDRDIIDIPQRMIAVDGRDGRLLSDRHMTEGSAADIVTAWQFPLHSGRAFGWPGRIVIFLAGISTCLFVVTGFVIWHRKRRARTARTQRWREPQFQPAE